MEKLLYVGNLTDSATQTNLEEWFAQYGTVQSAHLITDRDTGRSKGFGFVEMDTDAQAEAAIQGLNDHEHEGRRLIVSEAKPGDDRGGRRRSQRRRWLWRRWRSAVGVSTEAPFLSASRQYIVDDFPLLHR